MIFMLPQAKTSLSLKLVILRALTMNTILAIIEGMESQKKKTADISANAKFTHNEHINAVQIIIGITVVISIKASPNHEGFDFC